MEGIEGIDEEGVELNLQGFTEDQWIPLEGSNDEILEWGICHDCLVYDGGDEEGMVGPLRITSREEETSKQHTMPSTPLCERLRNGRLASSCTPVKPHDTGSSKQRPEHPVCEPLQNGDAGVLVALGSVEDLTRVVHCSGLDELLELSVWIIARPYGKMSVRDDHGRARIRIPHLLRGFLW